MKIKEVLQHLESLAPISSQESYDNAGLIVGNADTELSNALISLDCTEEIVDEAIAKGCNLIISHHPIVFKGLKRLNGKNYVERTVIKAIKNDVALYAIHTNLDNYNAGVNKKIGDLLGISKPEILSPSAETLSKIIVYVPKNELEKVKSALFEAGAGSIGNYSECSFSSEGTGSFKANEDANPVVGEKGAQHLEAEYRLEVIVSNHLCNKVISAMKKAHPYEEVAYDLIRLQNKNAAEGSGMWGTLDKEVKEEDFLTTLKETFNVGAIRHTNFLNKPIKKVAWCGGSGSFLLSQAKSIGADIFITGDFKYHEFFDAEDQIVIADIGHYESEQFTIELIADLIRKKFPTFAPYLTEKITNPVNYF